MATPAFIGSSKVMFALRVVAGLPLLVFGALHLFQVQPIGPLLEATGLPGAGVMSVVAPIAQFVAGLLLLSGKFVRFGAITAIGTMAGAIFTHIKIPNDQWPMPDGTVGDEPVSMIAIAGVIIFASCVVLWRGSGKAPQSPPTP